MRAVTWYDRSRVITAMASSDLAALSQWVATAPTQQPQQSFVALRNILGEITQSFNDASSIFKTGVRSPNPQTAAKAMQLLPNLQNIAAIHQVLPSCEQIVSGANPASIKVMNKYQPTVEDEYYTKQSRLLVGNLQRSLLIMIHMLERSNFTPEQLSQLQGVANNTAQQQPEYAAEVNASRLNDFLQNSIYSTKDASQRTLRVIREVLQNAVDATLKKAQEVEGHKPMVDISVVNTHQEVVKNNNVNIGDVIITDNGVGMDWGTLSEKFFVYFNSGKEDDKDAAGGFGIAKALIQEVPEQGWAIDTNGIHSSRFGKNMYMGTRQPQSFQPPRSNIQPTPNGGTSLALYKLELPADYSIADLCKKYATSGTITISVNGQPVSPDFVLGQLTAVGQDLNGIAETIGKNDTEKEIVTGLLGKHSEEISASLGNLDFTANGTQTSLKFYMQRVQGTGKFYCMVNNQYQFDDDYISKANIICNVLTNARPGTEDYPVDAGREHLRQPYSESANAVKNELKSLLEDVAKNELFKSGLNIFTFNKTGTPMGLGDSDESGQMAQAMSLGNDMRSLFRKQQTGTQQQNQPQNPNPQGGDNYNQPPTDEEVNSDLESEDVTGQEAMARVQQVIQQVAQQKPLTPEQQQIIMAVVENVKSQEDDKVDIKDVIDDLIQGLTTPCHVAVQKDFVSKDLAHADISLTTDLILAWQKVLQLVINKCGPRIPKYARGKKKFVPGLIYSDECLALYMPPQEGMTTHTIAINPITVAAIAQPKLFAEKITGMESKEAFSEATQNEDKETPVNRLATFLYHEAIHELCHLLYPDSWGGYEEFHMHISKLENICQSIWPQVRDVVKRHAQQIKYNSGKLIRAASKDIAKAAVPPQP